MWNWAPGLGISLDGRALLVGPGGAEGNTEIVGHLEDGTYPQRDTTVTREGSVTNVDGHHGEWRDYVLDGQESDFVATGATELEGFSVTQTDNGFRVESDYAARAWNVEETADGFSVSSDFEDGERFQISQQGAVTTVDSNFEEQDFSVTRQADGSVAIDGHLVIEDFTFQSTEDGYLLEGYYPQQRFQLVHSEN